MIISAYIAPLRGLNAFFFSYLVLFQCIGAHSATPSLLLFLSPVIIKLLNKKENFSITINQTFGLNSTCPFQDFSFWKKTFLSRVMKSESQLFILEEDFLN